jgi:hypothetical protein
MGNVTLDPKYPIKVWSAACAPACVLRRPCCETAAGIRVSVTRTGLLLRVPSQVLYCGACGNPPEYCAWTGAKVAKTNF